jgi:hypothetical protein
LEGVDVRQNLTEGVRRRKLAIRSLVAQYGSGQLAEIGHLTLS